MWERQEGKFTKTDWLCKSCRSLKHTVFFPFRILHRQDEWLRDGFPHGRGGSYCLCPVPAAPPSDEMQGLEDHPQRTTICNWTKKWTEQSFRAETKEIMVKALGAVKWRIICWTNCAFQSCLMSDCRLTVFIWMFWSQWVSTSVCPDQRKCQQKIMKLINPLWSHFAAAMLSSMVKYWREKLSCKRQNQVKCFFFPVQNVTNMINSAATLSGNIEFE